MRSFNLAVFLFVVFLSPSCQDVESIEQTSQKSRECPVAEKCPEEKKCPAHSCDSCEREMKRVFNTQMGDLRLSLADSLQKSAEQDRKLKEQSEQIAKFKELDYLCIDVQRKTDTIKKLCLSSAEPSPVDKDNEECAKLLYWYLNRPADECPVSLGKSPFRVMEAYTAFFTNRSEISVCLDMILPATQAKSLDELKVLLFSWGEAQDCVWYLQSFSKDETFSATAKDKQSAAKAKVEESKKLYAQFIHHMVFAWGDKLPIGFFARLELPGPNEYHHTWMDRRMFIEVVNGDLLPGVEITSSEKNFLARLIKKHTKGEFELIKSGANDIGSLPLAACDSLSSGCKCFDPKDKIVVSGFDTGLTFSDYYWLEDNGCELCDNRIEECEFKRLDQPVSVLGALDTVEGLKSAYERWTVDTSIGSLRFILRNDQLSKVNEKKIAEKISKIENRDRAFLHALIFDWAGKVGPDFFLIGGNYKFNYFYVVSYYVKLSGGIMSGAEVEALASAVKAQLRAFITFFSEAPLGGLKMEVEERAALAKFMGELCQDMYYSLGVGEDVCKFPLDHEIVFVPMSFNQMGYPSRYPENNDGVKLGTGITIRELIHMPEIIPGVRFPFLDRCPPPSEPAVTEPANAPSTATVTTE